MGSSQKPGAVLDRMPERIPYEGSFEVTLRCNLHCRMCMFRHDDRENPDLMAVELTASEWVRIARQAAAEGLLSLTITGGEALLRQDFCQLWEGIYRQGFLITLYTNATLVTDRVMETLSKYPPHKIGITLYGASAGTYEKVTGSGEAFERALAGIRRLQTLPSMMEFRTTVIQDNYPDIEAMNALVSDLTGGKGTLTQARMVFPAVRGGCSDVASCRLSPSQNAELMLRRTKEKMAALVREKGGIPRGYRIVPSKPDECGKDAEGGNATLLGCGAGMSTFAVTYDGRLVPCQLIDRFSVDLKSEDFHSAWQRLPWEIEVPGLCARCASCKISQWCSACPASRLAETGDMGGAPEYSCAEARELMKYAEYTDF